MTRRQRPHSSRSLVRALTVAVTAVSIPTLSMAQTEAARAPEDPNAPTQVGAERITGRPDREVTLDRDAEVTRGPMTLNADHATYDIVDDRVKAEGNVKMRRYNERYSGTDLDIKLDTGEGYINNPTYNLGPRARNAQGKAGRIDFASREEAVVQNGTYSTCEGPDPDWYLQSGTMNLDSSRDIGTASRSIVYFKGVPILGTPFITFPLSDQRKSGFLPPAIGTTSKGGIEVSTPYYLNIAPNRDLTLFPRIISRRGVQLGAQARYLGEDYSGQIRAEDLPSDRITGTNRYAYSITHAQKLAPGLTFGANLNGASDDNYPNDFQSSITNSSLRLLPRDLNLTYARPYWTAVARTTSYQVLQDPAAPITKPYSRLPQITVTGNRADYGGFDVSMVTDYTRFSQDQLVEGDRMVVNPRISYPIIAPGYFIRPSVSLNAASYNLQNTAPGQPTTITRTLPTLSVDSGLVFERDTSFLGRPATQTLEPRLFYVYTPYRNQNQIPLFDTALSDFSFAQLFSENRYIGYDRISDANQLTAAVVSRYLEEDGTERLRLALGQRFYFNQQLVTTGTAASENKSDILAAVSGQVTPTLQFDAGVQYSQSLHKTNAETYGVRWQPGPQRVLNLQRRRDVATALDLVDASAQWPLAARLYGVARVNYSMIEKKVSESLFGLEYKADCWVFRVVAQRTPTATNVATSSLFFQLELNGLSRLGSNPLTALRNNVPGYTPVNQPPLP
ncbi:LPS-assembly protein LptD [Noviherbaspirillum pedocola]|uniref:LPS-assembly protein LptD n=1 Tax=Noviherbaspirillum pedocola TaxID=2801341 RepID=A0A934SRC0_9BURK|nr:LPS-assembly protein LptD [Noviherbaspirillum pedocola]MBK4733716.1 LPS-assembly protein LptD [Noviherbaspirillum pedocola]